MDDLRRRLHFHTEKVRFVIDRLQLDLLTDADARADDVLGLVEQNLHVSDEILFELSNFRTDLFGYFAGQNAGQIRSRTDRHFASAPIRAKFKANLSVGNPASDTDDIPIVEGFDVLLLHFQQSTKGLDHTPERYLLFLKCRWILNRIKESSDYLAARPGFYYKRAVNQLENATKVRARRPTEVVAYEDSILLDLPNEWYLIWPRPVVVPPDRRMHPDQLFPRANEQQLLRVELFSGDPLTTAFVTVFKSSETHMRVVQEICSSDQKTIIPQQIDTSLDKIIPRYALPTLETSSWEMAIFSRNEESLFRFKCLSDLHQFQAAFTGYNVAFDHEVSNVRCQFSDSAKSLDCTGRIQLFQEPIVPVSAIDTSESPPAGSQGSSGSFAERSRSRTGSLISTAALTTSVTRIASGWESRATKLSALAVFTQLCDERTKITRFAIILTELTAGLYIEPTQCSCYQAYNECSKLVLAKRDKSNILARVWYSDAEVDGRPNPNSFDLFPLRIPRFSSDRAIPLKRTEYIVLKFKSLAEKRRCHEELELRFRIRDRQMRDQRETFEEFRRRGDRPERLDRAPTRNIDRVLTAQTVPIIASSPPRIEVPDSGPALTNVFRGASRRASDQSSVTPLSSSPETTTSTGTRSSRGSVQGTSAGTSPPSPRQSLQGPQPESRLNRLFRRGGQ